MLVFLMSSVGCNQTESNKTTSSTTRRVNKESSSLALSQKELNDIKDLAKAEIMKINKVSLEDVHIVKVSASLPCTILYEIKSQEVNKTSASNNGSYSMIFVDKKATGEYVFRHSISSEPISNK